MDSKTFNSWAQDYDLPIVCDKTGTTLVVTKVREKEFIPITSRYALIDNINNADSTMIIQCDTSIELEEEILNATDPEYWPVNDDSFRILEAYDFVENEPVYFHIERSVIF